MRNLLPRLIKNPQGFSLIELMVVITIMAILAVIAFSVFSGAQGSARDGRRVSEIASFGRSIEAARDFTRASGDVYNYTSTTAGTDFPKGLPVDPSNPTRKYCFSAITGTKAGLASGTKVNYDAATTFTTLTPSDNSYNASGCPRVDPVALCNTLNLNCSAWADVSTINMSNAYGWIICATLERGKATCQTSQTSGTITAP